jgi:hypothetical protein
VVEKAAEIRRRMARMNLMMDGEESDQVSYRDWRLGNSRYCDDIEQSQTRREREILQRCSINERYDMYVSCHMNRKLLPSLKTYVLFSCK